MDLDFTQTAAKDEAYDPAVAQKCFESFGKTESFAEGQDIFAEGKPSDRMYYIVEGEVGLSRNKKMLDIIKAGEVFGGASLGPDIELSKISMWA